MPDFSNEEVAELLKGDLDPGVKAQLAAAVGVKVLSPVPGEVVYATRQSETDLQKTVIRLLKANGYLVHAERAARSQKGWATPIMGDPGWFDVAAIHPAKHRILLLELKTDTGKLSPFQERWVMAANQCPGVLVMVVRPQDMAEFEEAVK